MTEGRDGGRGVNIRECSGAEEDICEEILRSLPDWFGLEEAIVQYRRDIASMDSYVAESAGGIVGFLTLKHHNQHTSEIQVMAVREEAHGHGVGHALVDHAERLLRVRATAFLQVKTLGPSRPDEHYDRTRKFYLALGFRPVEENNLWGKANPCLIMIKHLVCEE